MTLDVNKPPLSRGNRCSNSANIVQRFTTYAVALHWQGWFFFYKKSHKRMVVWSATHAMGFNQGKFARMKNSKHWEWWFRKLALAVKCRQLLPDRKQSVYFLNQVEGRELARNWKIYENGTKNDQLVMQCLKYKSSRLVLQAYGRQYRYWGRRPESGIIVHGDESTHIQKKAFPLPLDYHKQVLSARVRLLLARTRSHFRNQRKLLTSLCLKRTNPSSDHNFDAERSFFLHICKLGENIGHVFTNIMQYFNPLQNLTFIWRHSNATPSLRSGGLCTSIIRRNTKRNVKNITPSNHGRSKRSRLRKHLSDDDSICLHGELNKRFKNASNKQVQKGISVELVMHRLLDVKRNIFWEFMCRSCSPGYPRGYRII